MTVKKILSQTVLHIFFIIFCLLLAFPLFYMIMTSLRTDADVMYNGFSLFPAKPTLQTFRSVLSGTSSVPVLRWFINSLIVSSASAVLTVLIDALAAYGYSRMEFKGRDIIFGALMLTMMIPSVINLIPSYAIISAMRLKNNLLALILPGLGGVGNVFLIRQFCYSIPKQVDEAAAIDGAGHGRIFFMIILPQLIPVLTVVGMFTFIGSWNDLLWPMIVMTEQNMRTLTAGLSVINGVYDREYASKAAATVISALPILLIYLFAQKHLIQGFALSSGIKD